MPLSLRKSNVLKSGANRPVSHINRVPFPHSLDPLPPYVLRPPQGLDAA